MELARAARRLAHRGVVSACHEDDGGTGPIRERGHRRGKLVVLHLQPGVRAEARLAVRRIFEKSGPRARQAEQPQCVTCRRGVEDDVVPALSIAREQRRELIECRDLGRAGTGELLLELCQLRRIPDAAIRRDHALAVLVRSLLGIDVECEQALRAHDRRRVVRQPRAEHLIQVRGWIRADEQHALARIGELQRRRTRERSLPDPSFSREEHVARRIVEEAHVRMRCTVHARGRCAIRAKYASPERRKRPGCQLSARLGGGLRPYFSIL